MVIITLLNGLYVCVFLSSNFQRKGIIDGFLFHPYSWFLTIPGSSSTYLRGCIFIISFILSMSAIVWPATGLWSILPHLWDPGRIWKTNNCAIDVHWWYTSFYPNLVRYISFDVQMVLWNNFESLAFQHFHVITE